METKLHEKDDLPDLKDNDLPEPKDWMDWIVSSSLHENRSTHPRSWSMLRSDTKLYTQHRLAAWCSG